MQINSLLLIVSLIANACLAIYATHLWIERRHWREQSYWREDCMTRPIRHINGLSACILLLALCSPASAQQMQSAPQMLPGTVLCSRWNDESQNTTLGHWNHLAIYVGGNEVVEAQPDKGVIKVPLAEYLARQMQVKRFAPRTAAIGAVAADRAKSFVGQEYGYLTSVGPFWMFGRKNCVAVVEQAYRPMTGPVLGIRRPDHVYKLVDK